MNIAKPIGAYDVNRIRADFPILGMQVYGKPLVYLDNAASAQKPQAVLDRLNQAYTSQYANVHRGLHYLANEATEAYEGAREKVAAFLNAKRKEEIIFTRNATEAINLVAYTFGRERIKPCSRSWSTIPTSCRGISCASARARCSNGHRSTTRVISSSTSSRSF
jgi:cysteine desulfurase/selenocysteine lyase